MKIQTKSVLLAITILPPFAYASYFKCDCTITQIRLYQNTDLAVVYTDSERDEASIPSCAQGSSVLAQGLAINTKEHPAIFSTLLAAQMSGKKLAVLEGSGSCTHNSVVEDLYQIAINNN
ncbi:MAG: hypothetical protein ACFHVJ_15485 [Aestuariibacter sp.]